MSAKASPQWEKWLTDIETPEQYSRLVAVLFEDGKVNAGRWIILKLFTKDLCDRKPNRKPEFMRVFSLAKSQYSL